MDKHAAVAKPSKPSYLRFVIHRYRGIVGPIELNVKKDPLIPIIGVNESGKTTMLQAVFGFDYYNDNLNGGGRHLQDVLDLNELIDPKDPVVEAEIAIDPIHLVKIAEQSAPHPLGRSKKTALINAFETTTSITIERNLRTRQYRVTSPIPLSVVPAEQQDAYCRGIVASLPYILYFDDFRDSVDEVVPIRRDEAGKPAGWLAIVERLFRETDEKLSVFGLRDMDPRRRDGVLSLVSLRLNRTLTHEWRNFKLDDTEALEIAISYVDALSSDEIDFGSLRLNIIEKAPHGPERRFYIQNRSKGFYWFFNFVMKLEFNPKVLSEADTRAIYLLDEPGSYLHSAAQQQLCRKLRELAKTNVVIYCTHSHRLLDPGVIPLKTIRVAERDELGAIRLIPIHEHRAALGRQSAAFGPVMDALELRPFVMDMNHRRVVIVEGVYDYYVLELFKADRELGVVPAVGAPEMLQLISLAIGWAMDFRALWDNDDQGRRSYKKAADRFGEEVAARHLRMLPAATTKSRRVLQDLFDGSELRALRASLGLGSESSFEKVIASLFYAEQEHRDGMVASMKTTKTNLRRVFEILEFD